jgi:hypothetical protein
MGILPWGRIKKGSLEVNGNNMRDFRGTRRRRRNVNWILTLGAWITGRKSDQQVRLLIRARPSALPLVSHAQTRHMASDLGISRH